LAYLQFHNQQRYDDAAQLMQEILNDVGSANSSRSHSLLEMTAAMNLSLCHFRLAIVSDDETALKRKKREV
jgi:hypothetical protein